MMSPRWAGHWSCDVSRFTCRPEGGGTDSYELICYDCGDDPDLDYRDISPGFQRIRGPYRLSAGIEAYGQHDRLQHGQSPIPAASGALKERPPLLRQAQHLLGKVLGGAGVAPLQREAGQRAQVIYAEEMPVDSQPPGGGIGGSGSIGGLEDCEITVGRGTTTVRAELPDQAALLGFLHRIAGLGLEVVDMHQVDPPPER